MLSFDPPELEEQLKNALNGLMDGLKIDPMDIQEANPPWLMRSVPWT